jgi:hypothetical protein
VTLDVLPKLCGSSEKTGRFLHLGSRIPQLQKAGFFQICSRLESVPRYVAQREKLQEKDRPDLD